MLSSLSASTSSSPIFSHIPFSKLSPWEEEEKVLLSRATHPVATSYWTSQYIWESSWLQGHQRPHFPNYILSNLSAVANNFKSFSFSKCLFLVFIILYSFGFSLLSWFSKTWKVGSHKYLGNKQFFIITTLLLLFKCLKNPTCSVETENQSCPGEESELS